MIHKYIRFRLSLAIVLLAVATEASAQEGLYVRSDLGIVLSPSLRLDGVDNDWGTRCDLIINPTGVETGTECDTPPPPTAWSNTSGATQGFAGGLAVGYGWRALRVEGEYRFRVTSYHDYSPTVIGDVVTQDKAEQELEVAIGGAGHVVSRGLFANVIYDLPTVSRFTPYLGAGIGAVHMAVDYLSLWKRNDLPERIATFEDPLLKAKLAGTTTVGTARLTDTLLGYQVLGGIAANATDRFSIGLGARWAAAGTFLSEGREWDQLRSHDSTVGRGSTILYTVETADTGALSLTMTVAWRV